LTVAKHTRSYRTEHYYHRCTSQ